MAYINGKEILFSPKVTQGSGGGDVVLQTKSVTITENGTTSVIPDSGKALSRVTVKTNVSPSLQSKTVSPKTIKQTVAPSEGYDGLSQVTVNAMKLQEKTVNPSSAKQTVTADSGYDGLSQVVVSATPDNTVAVQSEKEKTITENGEIVITPDSGYDAMSSARVVVNVPTGSDVEVQAPKEVEITANGTYDITPDEGFDAIGGASVVVSVPSDAKDEEEGVLEITENGEYTIEPTAGKAFYRARAIVSVDTTPNLQSKSATPKTTSQIVSADGGYDGLESVAIAPITAELLARLDPNFKAENIADGVTIFGITGTHKGSTGGVDGSAYHYHFDDADMQWYESDLDDGYLDSYGYCPKCGCKLSENSINGAFDTNCPYCGAAITYDEGVVELRSTGGGDDNGGDTTSWLFQDKYLDTTPNTTLPAPAVGTSYTVFVDGVEIATNTCASESELRFESSDYSTIVMYDVDGWHFYEDAGMTSVHNGLVSIRINSASGGDDTGGGSTSGTWLFENEQITTEYRWDLPFPEEGKSYTCFVNGEEISTEIAGEWNTAFINRDKGIYLMANTDGGYWQFYGQMDGGDWVTVTSGSVSIRINETSGGNSGGSTGTDARYTITFPTETYEDEYSSGGANAVLRVELADGVSVDNGTVSASLYGRYGEYIGTKELSISTGGTVEFDFEGFNGETVVANDYHSVVVSFSINGVEITETHGCNFP